MAVRGGKADQARLARFVHDALDLAADGPVDQTVDLEQIVRAEGETTLYIKRRDGACFAVTVVPIPEETFVFRAGMRK